MCEGGVFLMLLANYLNMALATQKHNKVLSYL